MANKTHTKTVFICQSCGRESPKWLGRCPDCLEWNTMVETVPAPASTAASSTASQMQELSQVSESEQKRLVLPFAEFNRVLGGGLVAGSLVLLSGEPGIGKSTLLLQATALLAREKGKVIYISGEESLHQIKLRASRLGIKGEGLYILPETRLEAILQRIEELNPNLVVIDSIQTVFMGELAAAPGSVAQVRECTWQLMRWAKQGTAPVLITGHVTKDGSIAGPRIMEHIVDVVLYLEGEAFSAYRLLRSVKNRFGSTNEVGIFEMGSLGLVEVENPSLAFLSQRSQGAVGSAVVPTMEGTRPLLVEIQALTTSTSFGLPRRTANGVDFNRLLLLIAVLTKRQGLHLGNQDVIVNVAGGLKVNEPAADLGICLSIYSSLREVAIDPQMVAVGEVGLSGELRTVPQLERRIAEAARLGFQRCLVPRSTQAIASRDIQVMAASSLKQALGFISSEKT